MSRKFTPEMIRFLRLWYPANPRRVTARKFAEFFGWEPTVSQLSGAARRCGIPRAPRSGGGSASRLYSPEELAWLRAHYGGQTIDETAEAFNARFGRRLTRGQIKTANQIYRFGVAALPPQTAAQRATRFAPGGVGGQVRTRHAPLYSERLREGVVMIKIPGPRPDAWQSLKRRGWGKDSHWTPKARWVWTNERGPIPDGHVVAHKDGDPQNNDIGNLKLISRAALQALNRKSAPDFAGAEAEPARIALAQLDAATRAARRKGANEK
ncbi:MAG: HNH endonuclease [Gammaproteobacteria bacterium]|nr:HNH endonuclease [Gammaproteobacteria bacterium]MCY3689858.1 HNH endonuclease [Gammaproteobacteria bacterium]